MLPYGYKRLIIYIICIALIMLFMVAFFVGIIIAHLRISPQVTLNECFTRQVNMPYYPTVRTYGALISCLIKYESSGNPNAIGDNGTSFGILQFKKSTFKHYCVDRYGFKNDIMNPEIQKDCCQKMLGEGLINHWSVRYLCE